MEIPELVKKIEQTFGDTIIETSDGGSFPFLRVKLSSLKAVLSFCVHDPATRLDFLDCLTVSDDGKEFTAIYHLFSTSLSHRVNIKVSVDRNAARLPSLTGFWRAAHCYELEAAEMFGIQFEGHPEPRHLLLPDDWHGYPLRKDYTFPESYNGIEHKRAPLRKEHVRP